MLKISDLLKQIICLCLALVLAVSLIGCNSTDDSDKTSSDSSVSSNESTPDDSEITSEPTESTDDTADNGTDDTEEPDDNWQEEEEEEPFGYNWVVPLKVFNGGAPIIDL